MKLLYLETVCCSVVQPWLLEDSLCSVEIVSPVIPYPTSGTECLWLSPWTARRSNQSVVQEISPEYSLEGLMLKPNSNTLATWCEELTHWESPWCWERLKAGGEEDNREWDSWMASLTQRTWVWASSGNWWWTGKPDMLLSMRLQRVRHDWETELNWIDIPIKLL